MKATPDRIGRRGHGRGPALLLFVAVSVLWGIPYLFNDIALRDIGPLWLAAGRTVIAAAALAPLLLRGGRRRFLVRRWRAVFVIAIVEVAVPFGLIAIGQQGVPSGTTGVLIALEPILVAVIMLIVVRGTRLSLTGWLGLTIGLVGVGLLLGLDITGPAALLIVGAALSYAAGAVLISRLFADIDALTTTAAMIVTAAPILVLAAAVSEPFVIPSESTWVSLLVLGLACSAAGFTTFFALIRRAGPTVASVTTYASPIIALLAGVVVLGESISLTQTLSCTLILVGAGLVMRARDPHPSVKVPAEPGQGEEQRRARSSSSKVDG